MSIKIFLIVFFAQLIVVLALAAYVWNPVKSFEDKIVEPAARTIGIGTNNCPDNWKAVSASDEHSVINSCSNAKDINHPQDGDIHVILNEDNTLNNAFIQGSLEIFDCRNRDVWPSEINVFKCEVQ